MPQQKQSVIAKKISITFTDRWDYKSEPMNKECQNIRPSNEKYENIIYTQNFRIIEWPPYVYNERRPGRDERT